MSNNLEQMANDIFGPQSTEKLAAKENDLKKLINSADGQRVKSMVNKDAGALKQAVKKGDTAALQNALQSILKTEEGARLAKQLKDMLK